MANETNYHRQRKVKALIDLDKDTQLYVVDILYEANSAGDGSLLRSVFDVRADAVRHYEFARDRASTQWQRMYRVGITTIWIEDLESAIDHGEREIMRADAIKTDAADAVRAREQGLWEETRSTLTFDEWLQARAGIEIGPRTVAEKEEAFARTAEAEDRLWDERH